MVVCSTEGVKRQTRYVFRKSIVHGLRPIIVVNKIDRETASPDEVVSSVEDLICEFAEDESYLESPFIFASGANGFCYDTIPNFKSQKDKKDLSFILD